MFYIFMVKLFLKVVFAILLRNEEIQGFILKWSGTVHLVIFAENRTASKIYLQLKE